MLDVMFHVGDAPRTYHLDLLKPDGSIDETIEPGSERFGFDDANSGVNTAPDGSCSFTSSGLDITVTPLAASPAPNGVPVQSFIHGGADSDARPEGTQFVSGILRVTVLPQDVNADHAEFREVTV